MKGNSRSHHIVSMANKKNAHGCDIENLQKRDTNFEITNSPCSNDHQTLGVSIIDDSTYLQQRSNLLDLGFQNITEASSSTNINNTLPTSVAATIKESLDLQSEIDSVDLDSNNVITLQAPSSVTLNDHMLYSQVSLFEELENATLIDTLESEDTPLTSQAAASYEPLTINNELNPDNCDSNNCNISASDSTLILNSETGLFESAVLDSGHNEIPDNSVSIKDQRRLNQTLRLYGKSYKSKIHTAADGTKTSVPRHERNLKNVPCDHGSIAKSERSFLCGSMNEQARLDVLDYFWSLSSWEAKRSYIIGLVTVRTVNKRRKISEASTEADQRRNNGIDCYLPRHDGVKVRVCRDFLLTTLDIKKDSFTDWIKAKDTTKQTKKSLPLTSNNINESTRKTLKSDSVTKWLDELPKVPSHYCRANSSRVHVDDALQSLTKMHTVYSMWCQENQLPSVQRKKFCEILEIQKISIFKPRKDQCDTCVAYKEGNLDEATYQTHSLKKIEARDAKKRAISEASSEHCVATMDLQSVQLCPKLLTSAQYYKQKLQVHIFTIYINNNKDVIAYIWHEGDGGVTANEFITCIIDFIQKRKESKGYTKFTLISDGCAYQNENKVLASALADISKKESLVIEQIVLEKGHTMMEVDSVHSTLEKLFHAPLYTPGDYVNRIRQARPTQPYEVNHVEHTFFKNYDDVPSNFASIRPGRKAGDPTVIDIRALLYKNGEVWYKLFHHDDWTLLPQRRKPDLYQSPTSLYEAPRKIEKSKYDQLQLLKPYMHRDYHNFYNNLRF